jgi:hypothetical protein
LIVVWLSRCASARTRPSGARSSLIALWFFVLAAYRQAIERAGLTVETVRENEQYRFVSERADNATQQYAVKSISALARKRT